MNSSTIAVAALVMSGAAAICTFLQWREAHGQLLLSMKPSINITTSTNDSPAGISIENAGPGPAKIKSITYFVDGKQISDVTKILEFSNVPEFAASTLELDDGDTLGVGQKEWLIEYSSKPHGKKEQDAVDEFSDFLDHKVAVEVAYCPVIGDDCTKKCSVKNWCGIERK